MLLTNVDWWMVHLRIISLVANLEDIDVGEDQREITSVAHFVFYWMIQCIDATCNTSSETRESIKISW